MTDEWMDGWMISSQVRFFLETRAQRQCGPATWVVFSPFFQVKFPPPLGFEIVVTLFINVMFRIMYECLSLFQCYALMF